MAAKNFKRKEEKVKETASVPVFLGEIEMAKANNVLRHNIFVGKSVGVLGTLFFTNFKVAFTRSHNNVKRDESKPNTSSIANLEQLFMQDDVTPSYDIIPLTAISEVLFISTKKQKTKKLKPNMKEVSSHYNQIEFRTKDFRILRFEFKDAKDKSDINFTDKLSCFKTIAHYAFPRTVSQLFAFDYGQNMWKSDQQGRAFCLFHHKKDHEISLNRLKCSYQWRVTSINEVYAISKLMPKHNVCPLDLQDSEIKSFCEQYIHNRFPTWLWSDPKTGAALLLSSSIETSSTKTSSLKPSLKIIKNEDNNAFETLNPLMSIPHPKRILEAIKSCQSSEGSGKVTSVNVDTLCPSIHLLQESFVKLQKGCIIKSCKDYWNSDSAWLSFLEDSNWLKYISVCLRLANSVTATIKNERTSVIVNDSTGHDFSLVISSLVQIQLDPYYRTSIGLQALIQKDWVVKGHPFKDRLRHLYDTTTTENESPVFLLFVNCLQQLIYQFPIKFEYTEYLLILLVDCAYTSLFGTFIFNSEYEFHESCRDGRLVSVWDFIASNIPQSKFELLFINSCYRFNEVEPTQYDGSKKLSMLEFCGEDVIFPQYHITAINLWNNLFYRWIDNANEVKGFSTTVMLNIQQHQILEDVECFQDRLIYLQNKLCEGSSRETLTPQATGVCISNSTKNNKYKRNKYNHNNDLSKKYKSLASSFYFLKML